MTAPTRDLASGKLDPHWEAAVTLVWLLLTSLFTGEAVFVLADVRVS